MTAASLVTQILKKTGEFLNCGNTELDLRPASRAATQNEANFGKLLIIFVHDLQSSWRRLANFAHLCIVLLDTSASAVPASAAIFTYMGF